MMVDDEIFCADDSTVAKPFEHDENNCTNNTDWMYKYELPMNEKVKAWLAQQ